MNDRQLKEFVNHIQQDRIQKDQRSNSVMMAPKMSTLSGQRAKIGIMDDFVYVKAVHIESDGGKSSVRTETASIPLGVRFQAHDSTCVMPL